MQLSRIRVRNIRSYVEATLDLGPGTTLLVGDVGAGKTSLLYAVEMALFGTAEIEATFLVRHGATEAEVEVTLQDGDHQYQVHRSFRRIRRKGKETFEPGRIAYRQDGATTTYSATELRQRVIELLGFRDNPNPRAHSDLWRWAVYIPQERMREILSAPPKDRLETVRRALGVERYRLAAENAKEVARDLRGTAAGLRGKAELLHRFDEDFETASAEMREVEGLRVAGEKRWARLGEERAHAVEAATAGRDGVHRLEADRRVRTTLTAQDATDRRALDELERGRAARVRESTELEQELATDEHLAAEGDSLRSATSTATGSIRRLRKELEVLASTVGGLPAARARQGEAERRMKSLDVERERGRVAVDQAGRRLHDADTGAGTTEPTPPTPLALEELDRELGSARDHEGTARDSATLARRNVVELQDLVAGGVCPRCGQAVEGAGFESHRREAERARGLAEAALVTSEAARVRWESLRSERQRFEQKLERWQGVERRRTDLAVALTIAEDALRRTETAWDECRNSLEKLRQEVDALAPAEGELAALRGRLSSQEEAESALRVRLELAERARERIDAHRARITSLGTDLSRLATEVAAVRLRVAERATQLEELNASVAREPELRRVAEETHRLHLKAEEEWQRAAQEQTRWTTRLEGLQTRVARAEQGRAERVRLAEAAETVEAKATWLSGGFHDAVLTMESRVLERAQAEFEHAFQRYFAALVDDLDLRAVTDSYFSPAAEIRGVWTPAEALSGGERTSLALAYRLALARVVRSAGHLRFDSLLLDEPTDGFSPEQVQSMGQLLEELALPQILLVSHERALESVAQRVVSIEKVGGRSALVGPAAERVPDDTVDST
ncbi:MAG: SMC family ATPase [Thermoplasmata archaeon]|nr:SMC family ATPase [Thermoplasmata archaeon]